MLGNYEKRAFSGGETVWVGHYKNLNNVLHWHVECEIITIAEGKAQIKIGDQFFNADKGDSFFCAGEELHCIISEPDSQVDIMIVDKSISKNIADKYTLLSPRLPASLPINDWFLRIENELRHKSAFYCEALENLARALFIDIFRESEITIHDDSSLFNKKLIHKINEDFAFISYDETVRYSGYSPSHFSKVFKALSGMTFSEYLNIIKIENAIAMMHHDRTMTMTSVSNACGFSTVRNFNRVFKKVTGYSPRSLPEDFMFDTGLRIPTHKVFNPTESTSELIL